MAARVPVLPSVIVTSPIAMDGRGGGVGVQIPIPRDPIVSATYNGQQVPAQPTANVPQAVIDQAQTDKNNVQPR